MFAESVGLDNDAGWGKGRFMMLVIGLFTIVGGILYARYTDRILHIFRRVRSHFFSPLSESIARYGYTFPFLIIIILVYIWVASSGSWTHWISATRYYADLANAFEHKQLHLLTRPSAELLAVTNPYDPALRKGIKFPIDYALFDEKFYIYWGPVPALLLILINPFVSARVGDLYLAFGFISGILILQYLLLLTVWDRFFRSLPRWMLIVPILVSGLSGPWTYMLVNEPNGRIYEAAIAGAQCFLLGGLFIAVRAFAKSNLSHRSLSLAGFLWGLAIGTRLILVVPIGIACLMIAYYLWKTYRTTIVSLGARLMALGIPLLICLGILGWYNWARFGSVTDTGFAYSLAYQDMLKYQSELFSLQYIVQNLYNYILHAPGAIAQFPFLISRMGAENTFQILPEVYQTQPITGLIYIAPFTFFAIIPIIPFFKKTHSDTADAAVFQSINAIYVLLFGAFLFAFCFLWVFFWAALRYMGDFIPELILLGSIGFWHGFQRLDQQPVAQRLYAIAGVALAITGITISLLITLSGGQYHFSGF